MTRASIGRLGRVVLAIVGMLALLSGGAGGMPMGSHAGSHAVPTTSHGICAGCFEEHRQAEQAQAASCAAPCAAQAILASAPPLPPVRTGPAARPGPVALSAGRNTRPEPEPPRPSARA